MIGCEWCHWNGVDMDTCADCFLLGWEELAKKQPHIYQGVDIENRRNRLPA